MRYFSITCELHYISSIIHYIALECSIIAQERLNRITQFISEMALNDYVPSASKLQDQTNDNMDSPNTECFSDWMSTAIPLGSAVALTAAAAGIISDDEVPSSSLRTWEPQSPESVTASEASDLSQVREVDGNGRRNMQYSDVYVSEASDTFSDGLERMQGSYENGQTSPEIGTFVCSRSRTPEWLGSSESVFRW